MNYTSSSNRNRALYYLCIIQHEARPPFANLNQIVIGTIL